MKRWSPLVVFLLLGCASMHAETVQEVYARGVRAYIGGNPEAARQLFVEVLATDPNHKSATAYIRRIDSAKPGRADIRKQMEGVIVPKVDFRDVSLTTVLDYLPKVAAEQSGGRATLNIVRMFPSDYGRDKLVTLQLTGAPMANVLDYIAQLSGLTLDYQAHAVVFSRPATTAAAPAQ